MTHQLHCLFMMTHIYAGLATNDTSRLPHDYNSHYLHCIDYLRQGVMCAADLATEPHRPTDSDDNGPGDGSWGGLHVCKDYGQVTEYLERELGNPSSPVFVFYFPKIFFLFLDPLRVHGVLIGADDTPSKLQGGPARLILFE